MSLSQQFQVSNETREDRFPKIFGTVRKHFPKPESILSFGCSTGAECLTLAEKYFPESQILGYDLNKWSVSQAIRSRNLKKAKNVFFSSELKEDQQYDVVFALMVFFSIEKPIPKGEFNRAVKELSRRVKPGGLIAFHNLEHKFSVRGFRPVRTWEHENNRNPGKTYYGGVWRRKVSIFEKIYFSFAGNSDKTVVKLEDGTPTWK